MPDVPGLLFQAELALPPLAVGAGLVARMDELDLASSGQFRHAKGDRLLW